MLPILSEVISDAVSIAVINGNEVSEISEGWIKVRQVVFMRDPLIGSVKDEIFGLSLRHWITKETPHNLAQEGFTDDNKKVAIVFPIARHV